MKSSLHRLEPIPLQLNPAEVAAAFRHLPGLVFFDSALEAPGEDQFSLVAACPREVISGAIREDWDRLKQKLEACNVSKGGGEKRGFPEGMAAGYVGYDGDFCFGIYPELLVFEHATRQWFRFGTATWSAGILPSASVNGGNLGRVCSDFTPVISREDFCLMVQKAQEYIAAGDIYQVNLSQQFVARWEGDPWGFYEQLRLHSPAPHAAYLQLGGRTLLSSSPELFLRLQGDMIWTKPIKGTRPRFADPVADQQSAQELQASRKETAELVMITDLERNDLGQCCQFGSVTVTELLKLESFAQVFHLVSTVQGRLRKEVDHPAALKACFPGGSITGAPKKRAMEIITELEPIPRGVYTGAIGYFGFNGESQFNIAIRTVTIEAGKAHFHVGAGIVADSIPEMEYEETLHKAAGILLAAQNLP